MRDISERGRTLDGVLHQYEKFVKPSFDEFIFPVSHSFDWFIVSITYLSFLQTKKYADVIIPRGIDNQVSLFIFIIILFKFNYGFNYLIFRH